ncbi:MAG: hypothetical protein RL701_8170 [Pseudomonadota bacterium]
MSFSWWLRMLLREARAARGRFVFFVACIAAGVTAVVGVAALSEAIEQGMAARSRELLGGDLAVEGRGPLPALVPLLPAATQQVVSAQADLCILSSVVRNESGTSRLAELKAVSDPRVFPLAGVLAVTPQRPLSELLQDDTVLVARSFIDTHELAIGAALYVGGVPFRVAGVVEREPDPLNVSFVYGPRVLLTRAGLERTQLLALGHRVRYRSVLRFGPAVSLLQLQAAKRALESKIPGAGSHVRVETHAEAQPTLGNTLEHARHYLGLVALLSLLIAASGVAQIVSAWLAQVTSETAILRCIGLRPRDVLWLYLTQIVLLACVGSALGAIAGAGLPYVVAQRYPELLPPATLSIPWWSIARGCGLGVLMALVFSLPQLISIWKVSPARVLRADAEPLPVPLRLRVATLATLLVSVWLAAWAQSTQALQALGFTVALCVIAALLWLAARGLLWCLGRVPRQSVPALLWHGAAALLRPGAGLVSSCVALGMGNLVVLSMALVQGVMSNELANALPKDAPSVFMLDIQPDQWAEIERAAHSFGATQLQRAPVVMARLQAVDGRGVEQLVRERAPKKSDQERERWVFTREQRITSLRELPDNNRVTAGALWARPGVNEISVEEDFARDLGAGLGTQLRFDVQGVPVDFVVTSLRHVEWRRFAVSFFLIAKPGVLDDAPQFVIGAARLPREVEQRFQDQLAKSHPNVTLVRVRELLELASELVVRLGIALRFLGFFGVLVGTVMLAGAVAAGQLRRAREVALLKTLGLTRARIVALFAVEYALLGLVSGVVSAAGAFGLTWLFTRAVLHLMVLPSVSACVIGAGALSVLAVVAGLLASARALTVAPLEVLRDPL